MGVLRAIGSGLITVLGALGTVILFVIVLIALPLFIAGVLVHYMMFRPEYERNVVDRLRRIEDQLEGIEDQLEDASSAPAPPDMRSGSDPGV